MTGVMRNIIFGGPAPKPYSPVTVPSLEAWTSFANPYLLSQERDGVQALTASAADADPVGQMVAPAPTAHYLAISSDVLRPQLGSGGGRNAWALFGDLSQNRVLIFKQSKRAFDFMYQTGAFSIVRWVRSDLDGQASQVLLESNDGSTANAGLFVQKNVGNTLTIQVTRASAGQSVVNITTAQTLTVADGWQLLKIRSNGTTCTVQIGSKSPESVSVGTLAASTVHALNDLSIGRQASQTTRYFRGALGEGVITSAYLSDANLAKFAAYNPARISRSPAYIRSGHGESADQHFGMHTWIDANQPANSWTDIGKTTPVATDGDAALVIGSANGDRFARNAVAAGAGTALLYKTGVSPNGKAGFYGDGSVTERTNTFEASWPSPRSFHQVLVVKNLDAVNGSHFLWWTGHYLVLTAKNYNGAIYPGEIEAVVHMGDNAAVSTYHIEDTGGPYIIEFWRNGSTIYLQVNGQNLGTATNTSEWRPSLMGKDTDRPEWDLKGYVYEVVTYLWDMPAAERTALRLGLAAKWGVPGVI